MDHAIISIGENATMVTPNERLEALKARYVPTPNNQQQVGDGDLNKIMDRALYKATIDGDADKFIDALEVVSESRKLALSLIFDQVTPSGNSLLHVAASWGNNAVVELILIHFPYLVTRKNSSDDTPLHVAIQDGRLNATRKLISRRRDSEIIYWKNKDSKSPLYLAAETGDMEIFRLLLEACARDEDYPVKIQGMSPVLAACEEWEWESGASSNNDLTSKLHPNLKSAMAYHTTGILEEIIDRLPKLLHVRDENGGTPLHSAASAGNWMAVKVMLRECPYLALQMDKDGSYPIHIACEGGDFFTISALIRDTWPDLAEIKNNKGQNILHVAAKAGNANSVLIISILCDEDKVDIKKLANSKDFDGNTPLHLASMHNHCEVMRSLTRDKSNDLGLLNNDQLTALDVAMEPQSFSSKDPAVL